MVSATSSSSSSSCRGAADIGSGVDVAGSAQQVVDQEGGDAVEEAVGVGYVDAEGKSDENGEGKEHEGEHGVEEGKEEEDSIVGEAVIKPIVFGSIAHYLGKKTAGSSTHQWSIYARGLEDEDLSYLLKSVTFRLHPSCENPLVVCEAPPYFTTQSGWGEFSATISLKFRDVAETTVDAIHHLRLYHGTGGTANPALLKKPVVNECYEELIFEKPGPSMLRLLKSYDPASAKKNVSPPELREHFQEISEVKSMEAIVQAQNFVKDELERAARELAELQEEQAALQNKEESPVKMETT